MVIFQIFDKEMDTYGAPPTIAHFHNAWVTRGLDHTALDRIFVRHTIPEPAPLFGPGSTRIGVVHNDGNAYVKKVRSMPSGPGRVRMSPA